VTQPTYPNPKTLMFKVCPFLLRECVGAGLQAPRRRFHLTVKYEAFWESGNGVALLLMLNRDLKARCEAVSRETSLDAYPEILHHGFDRVL
jgi:hypothetical protein